MTLPAQGCGGSDRDVEQGDGSNNPVETDVIALHSAMIEEACRRQVECGYPVLNQGATQAECLTLVASAEGRATPGMFGADVVLSRERLEECRQSLAAATCEDVANKRMEIDPSCTRYWVGTLEQGQACRGGLVSDCEEGLFCDVDSQTCPGACRVIPDPCVEAGCGAGQFCSPIDGCSRRAAVGDPCEIVPSSWLSETSCLTGAYCREGLCAPRVPQDGACAGDYPGECAEGLACRCVAADCSSGRTCVPQPALGEPCLLPHDCAAGQFCNYQVGGGTCDERRAEGDACPATIGACAPGLYCDDGVCVTPTFEIPDLPLLQAGADCAAGGICPLGQACQCAEPDCSSPSRVCGPAVALGESCLQAYVMNASSPFVCAQGVCDYFGAFTCVAPQPAGGPCIGPFTMACAYQVCNDGLCASPEETQCAPVP